MAGIIENLKYLAASSRPSAITVPAAMYTLHQLANIPYPNAVFEIAHRPESWAKLLDNSKRGALSPSTSIQAVIGMKIFRNHISLLLDGADDSGSPAIRLGPTVKVAEMHAHEPSI